MKRRLVFLLMAMVLGGAGCVSQKPLVEGAQVEQVPQIEPSAPFEISEGQVMVECRFIQGLGEEIATLPPLHVLEGMKGIDILSAPKIITLEGQEAQIAISEERSFPGSKEPMELGVKLAILPVVKDGMISFEGSCSVKELANIKSGGKLQSASIITRESVFSGTADPGQDALLTLPSIKGEAIKVTLKFTLVDEQGRHPGAD